jgi:hypothetical protein
MGVLSWAQHWLGAGGAHDDGAAPSAKVVQDPSRFRFSPHLIASLEADHVELLRQYAAIEKMALSGRLATIPPALSAFKARFDVHVLNENLHFYCYVEQKARGQPDSLALIQGFRNDMNALARGVVNFVKKYRTVGVRPINSAEFLEELRAVGQLLVQRVEHEEHELYTLYQP